MRILLALIVLLLAVAPAAHARLAYAPGAPAGRHAEWLAQSHLPTPPLMRLNYSVCPTGPPQSCTYPGDPVNVWIDPSGWDAQWLFMHEVGHLYGFAHLELQWGNYERWADVYMRCAISGWAISPGTRYVAIDGAYLRVMRADLYQRTCRRIAASAGSAAA